MRLLRRNREQYPQEILSSTKQRLLLVRGRLIVADMPYLLPKDVEDANRLDFQHYLLRVALQGLYAAPVKNSSAILDVATGTGRWAMDMARLIPRAVVTGFDLVPPLVDDATNEEGYDPGKRPANYVFRQGNMFDGLPFPDNTFDFVHMRLVYAATPVEQWPPLIAELTRVTRPGGYVELVEGFILIDAGPATNTIQNAILEASRRRGIEATYGKNIRTLLNRAGLQHVQGRQVYVPVGKRHGRLGTLAEKDIISVFRGIGALVVAEGIMDAEEWNRLFEMMPGELAETVTLWPIFQAHGKKPL